MADTSGILYVVATPIGNRGDLSTRAREVLSHVALVAAEDTRHTSRLFSNLINKPSLVSYHEHNETRRTGQLLRRLEVGDDVALVSDAGTPLVSDPGYRLVRAAREAGFRVSPVPGPCAAIAALSVSGLPTDRFLFVGFPPARAGQREKQFGELAASSATLVFYEAPHRIESLLTELQTHFGPDRDTCLARELTKAFETLYYGTLAEVAAQVNADSCGKRGEMVLIVGGAQESQTDDASLVDMLEVLLEELPTKQAVRVASRLSGERRNRVYELATQIKDDR